jgi:hypothetical protein
MIGDRRQSSDSCDRLRRGERGDLVSRMHPRRCVHPMGAFGYDYPYDEHQTNGVSHVGSGRPRARAAGEEYPIAMVSVS